MYVPGPYVASLPNWTPMIAWYWARFLVKNTHHQHVTCHDQIGLYICSIVVTILGSAINMYVEGAHVIELKSKRVFTLTS